MNLSGCPLKETCTDTSAMSECIERLIYLQVWMVEVRSDVSVGHLQDLYLARTHSTQHGM